MPLPEKSAPGDMRRPLPERATTQAEPPWLVSSLMAGALVLTTIFGFAVVKYSRSHDVLEHVEITRNVPVSLEQIAPTFARVTPDRRPDSVDTPSKPNQSDPELADLLQRLDQIWDGRAA